MRLVTSKERGPAVDDLSGVSLMESAGDELTSFVRKHEKEIADAVATNGAVLVRGCSAAGADDFQHALAEIGFKPMEYTERSTPRSQVTDGVFTSTEYPAREVIPQHCESSYANSWPGRLAFFCVTPPETGGATPIADVFAVVEHVPPKIVDDIRTRGLRYVRNYGSGVGLDWRSAFQAEDRADVERFCAENGLKYEWLDGDCLRTTREAPGFAKHPVHGNTLWFNHMTLFHQSALRPEIRAGLVGILGADRLPNDVFYGDGTVIPDETVDAVRTAFARNTRRFDWRANDLMVIDNMRWSHGREAFTGPRKILVSMTDPVSKR